MSCSQLGQRLARQRVHQVQVEGVEGARGLFHSGQRLRAVVHAAQGLQVRVVEALHAHRQARDAGRAKGAKRSRSKVPGLASSVISHPAPAAGARGCRPSGGRCLGENRLGVPPPMKMLCTGGPRPAAAPPPDRPSGHPGSGSARAARPVASRHSCELKSQYGHFLQAPGQVHIQRQRRQAGSCSVPGRMQCWSAHLRGRVLSSGNDGDGNSQVNSSARASVPPWRRGAAAVAVGVFDLGAAARQRSGRTRG
jgi:hypothetical protein